MNKLYKKLIFIFVCTLILSTYKLSAQNLILNPGFETGLLVPWTAGNGNTVNIVNDAQEGMWAANGNIEQIVKLEEGVKYTWTCQVKCLGGCDKNMWIGVKDLVADALVTNFLFSDFSEYGEAKIEFTASSTGDHRFWVWGVAETNYISDNHVLLKEFTTSLTGTREETNKIQITSKFGGIKVNIEHSIKNAVIDIHDLSGKLVYRKKVTNGDVLINKNEFNANGIYIVAVVADQVYKVSKVAIH